MHDATLMVKKLRFVTVKLTECMKGVCAFPQPLKAYDSFLITFNFYIYYAIIKAYVISLSKYVVPAHFLKYMEIEFPNISYYCFVSFSNYYGKFLKIPNGISSFISDLHAFLC